MSALPLTKARIRNFKAIRDSGEIEFGPLTVFIGNNGSGKSSVVEALESVQALTLLGLDAAMQRYKGLHNIRHQLATVGREVTAADGSTTELEPDRIWLEFAGNTLRSAYEALTQLAERDGGNRILIAHERVVAGGPGFTRDEEGVLIGPGVLVGTKYAPGVSLLRDTLGQFIASWQFTSLHPEAMGQVLPRNLAAPVIRLLRDGSNIAEYLEDLRAAEGGVEAFNGLIDALRFVLPYAVDLQPMVTGEIERSAYLQMKEQQFNVPGWLLSTGTLRTVALLALLRHPKPPPVLFIEEIENGLDPRTIGLIVQEIRDAVQSDRQQIVLTTHSPYLLDLFPLESIVVVDRVDGAPEFWRPKDDATIREWSKKFAPGRLYTTGALTRGAQP